MRAKQREEERGKQLASEEFCHQASMYDLIGQPLVLGVPRLGQGEPQAHDDVHTLLQQGLRGWKSCTGVLCVHLLAACESSAWSTENHEKASEKYGCYGKEADSHVSMTPNL